MVESVFLTDTRREVLDGESDLPDQSLANEKYRIRKRAQLAIDELTEVAEGSEIDNSTVFDSGDLARLVAAVLQGSEPIIPRHEYGGTDREYRDRYTFEIDTCWKIQHTADSYADALLRRELPAGPEDPDLLEDDPTD